MEGSKVVVVGIFDPEAWRDTTPCRLSIEAVGNLDPEDSGGKLLALFLLFYFRYRSSCTL